MGTDAQQRVKHAASAHAIQLVQADNTAYSKTSEEVASIAPAVEQFQELLQNVDVCLQTHAQLAVAATIVPLSAEAEILDAVAQG